MPKTINLSTDLIQKTTGVCGGEACIRKTRIPVWTLVSLKKMGATDQDLLKNYPSLTQIDLDAMWHYYQQNQTEIEQAILAQDDD
jgi:type III restriction enzyme